MDHCGSERKDSDIPTRCDTNQRESILLPSNATIGLSNSFLMCIFTKSKDWRTNRGSQQFYSWIRIKIEDGTEFSDDTIYIKTQSESLY